MLARLVRSQTVRQNVLLVVANGLAGVFSYLLQAVLGRLLGLAAFGTVASLIALSAFLLIPTQIITAVVARFSARLQAEGETARLSDLVRLLTLRLLPVGAGLALLLILFSAQVSMLLHIGSVQGVMILGLLL